MENISKLRKEEVIERNLVEIFPNTIENHELKTFIDIFKGKSVSLAIKRCHNSFYEGIIHPLKNMSGEIIGGTVEIYETDKPEQPNDVLNMF